MNTKTITTSILTGVVASFLVASSVSAFWPFDALFKKEGKVKASQTSKAAQDWAYYPGTGGSRADYIYKTLKLMNESCSQLLTGAPTPTRGVPTKTTTGSARVENKIKVEEATRGGTVSNANELESIYNQLKSRCADLKRLLERMGKIYKSPAMVTVTEAATPISVTPARRPLFNFGNRPEKEEKTQ